MTMANAPATVALTPIPEARARGSLPRRVRKQTAGSEARASPVPSRKGRKNGSRNRAQSQSSSRRPQNERIFFQ